MITTCDSAAAVPIRNEPVRNMKYPPGTCAAPMPTTAAGNVTVNQDEAQNIASPAIMKPSERSSVRL